MGTLLKKEKESYSFIENALQMNNFPISQVGDRYYKPWLEPYFLLWCTPLQKRKDLCTLSPNLVKGCIKNLHIFMCSLCYRIPMDMAWLTPQLDLLVG